jgi:predicted nucleic acid-binding protein
LASFAALFDADVLASVRLTDIAIRLARTGLFRMLWSATIHNEWGRVVAKLHPHITAEQIDRRRSQMDLAMPQALVADFEMLVGGLALPDPDDRHVLAAAIKARADVIVTFNLKDFPDAALEPFGIEAQHPDVFLSYQRTLDETRFLRVIKEARAALINPPVTADDYVAGLRRQGLQTIADELEKAKPLI